MSETFEQGWSARPFKEQFPELGEDSARRLDRLNKSIFEFLMADLITQSQCDAIRSKRFPKVVSEALAEARAKPAPKEAP